MRLKRYISPLAILFILPIYSGCATTYHSATGEKGQVLARIQLHALSEMTRRGTFLRHKDDVIIKDVGQVVQEIDGLVNPNGFESIKNEIANKSWDQLSGEEFIIRTGESTDEILKKLGPPQQKIISENRKFDEIWEYDFCTIYFKKNKVKKLIYKKVKQPAYQVETRRFLWFEVF